MNALRNDPTDCSQCATRAFCLLGELPAAQLQALQPLVRKRAFRRRELLAQEGEVAHSIRVVKVGSVFGYRRGLDGRSRPIGIAGRGASFGALGILGQRNPASAVAVSTGRVCEIPMDALRQVQGGSAVPGCVAAAAARSCGQLAAWSEVMRVRGLANQLAYTLLLLADSHGTTSIELPTHTALAELLGTTRETVVRALATLEAEGAIHRRARKHCELQRPLLLQRLTRG